MGQSPQFQFVALPTVVAPKLKSLDRREVQKFLDEYDEYSSSHAPRGLKTLVDPGLLNFFKQYANAGSDAEIIEYLRSIVYPQNASSFEEAFADIQFDLKEPDGVVGITKLFADFEIALNKTNLGQSPGTSNKKYTLKEKTHRQMILDKLPRGLQDKAKLELKYRRVDTMADFFQMLSQMAKDWTSNSAESPPRSTTAATLSLGATTNPATGATNAESTASGLKSVRLNEMAKLAARAEFRANQLRQ